MHYRSIFDLQTSIAKGIHLMPADLDLIVGVPRSGLLAANMMSLITNLPLADLDGYLEGRLASVGKTKPHARLDTTFADVRKVLILDDSVNVGEAMAKARARVAAAGHGHEVVYAAVYGQRPEHEHVDIVFEVLPQPRVFQWNLMHHNFIERACVDIDGVLCRDPTEHENDDGANYIEFLLNASPLHLSTRTIKTLVTSRLEKYRAETEDWLAQHEVRYETLVMLDLPSKQARQEARAHGSFKADHYRNSDAILFIESELGQAREIAQRSGKPVICLETHTLFDRTNAFDDRLAVLPVNRHAAAYRPPLARRVKSVVRSTIGSKTYEALKRFGNARACQRG